MQILKCNTDAIALLSYGKAIYHVDTKTIKIK